jgi:hypothetical protein
MDKNFFILIHKKSILSIFATETKDNGFHIFHIQSSETSRFPHAYSLLRQAEGRAGAQTRRRFTRG